eukprot:1144641-Pelagomonas_calceolata.AAC.6
MGATNNTGFSSAEEAAAMRACCHAYTPTYACTCTQQTTQAFSSAEEAAAMGACRHALQRVALRVLRFIEAAATERAGGLQAFVSVLSCMIMCDPRCCLGNRDSVAGKCGLHVAASRGQEVGRRPGHKWHVQQPGTSG